MSSEQEILTTKNLTIGYKNTPIISALDLSLKKGELTCLLGPNGSGKSTLIRSLSGIQKALSGEVFLEGVPLANISLRVLAQKISLVLTDSAAPGNLTVYALVSLGRFPYTNWTGSLSHSDQELIHQAMSMTDTLQFADRHVGELSDGEKQKVMIARALVQDTDIIILDEPTAHLDPPNRIEIFNLLQKLTTEAEKTILVSTHETDMAIAFGGYMWLVMPGQVMMKGLPEDLILSGHLEKAFGSENLVFEYLKGHFTKEKDRPKTAEIIGDPAHVKWTENALFRCEVPKDLKIEIQGGLKNPEWKIRDTTLTFTSIESLIKHIEQTKK